MSQQLILEKTFLATAMLVVAILGTNNFANAGIFADRVESFASGSTATPGYNDPTVTLGPPTQFYGAPFPSVVSPFSPAYLATDNFSIGEGGQLTLRFSNYVKSSAGGPEIGVFSSGGIIDTNFATHQAGPGLSAVNGTFSIGNTVNVEVSAEKLTWVSLGSHLLDVPTDGYTNLTDPYATSSVGGTPSDFGQPFTGNLSSFNNLTYTQMLTMLNGSGGGTWLDISSTGLSDIGYIRFTLPDDGNPATELELKIDAVSVANGFSGAPLPEPSTLLLAAVGAAGLLLARQRSRRLR